MTPLTTSENSRDSTDELHRHVIEALGASVLRNSDLAQKPLELDLRFPLPSKVRAYVYNATVPPGGRATGEHKIQLIVPGQARGERGNFAGLALILAVIGIYGMIAYSVSQRTREMGLRMALGANPGDVLRLVLWQGLKLVSFGLVFGVSTALAMTRFMSSLLFGVTATDPVTFVSVVILLTLVAVSACYIPARRAMSVDPMVALRHE